MRLSWSWLGEMVELHGSPEELCAKMTFAGIETGVAEDARPAWDGVVTALLREVARHPDADKLTVTRPWDGSTERLVVCGATNHKSGDVVALATPGTTLPDGTKIKKSKLRGVESEGMLCSQRELGISAESEGILILPPGTPVGRPLRDVLPGGDVILEVAPTANRGDCLSVLGFAREVAAVTGWALKGRSRAASGDGSGPGAARAAGDPDATASPLDTLVLPAPVRGLRAAVAGGGGSRLRVELDDARGCPRYCGAIVHGVRVGPSPDWMRKRLSQMGVRPISNVVDCTNYVMLELGNPLHAFDRRFLRGGVLRIRRAAEGEAMTTLDGRAHALRADDLLIADAEGGVALAGVMGGANSEVRDDTASLFLESAHFDPETVRRTAARLRMTSESSHRFSRGVDPELPGRALARLIELLEQTAGAQLLGELVDLYPEPVARPPVTLRPERIRGLLGMEIPPGRVLDLLRRAGLDAEEHAQDGALRVRVQAPSYRFDIEREVDVLEELARLQGYDSIPETPPSRPLRAVPRQAAGHDLGRIRSTLASLGLSECIHFSFVDRGWMEALGLPAAHPWLARTVRIGNPLSEVGGILRPTLLGSLLRAAARNRNAGADDVRLFELRNTFLLREDGFAAVEASGHGGPSPAIERRCVAGVLMGRRNAPGWAADGSALDFADLKALAEALEAVVQWRGFRWDSNNIPAFLDAREAAVLVRAGAVAAGDPLAEPPGWLGRIAAPVLQAFELDAVAWAFEIDLDAVTPKKRADLRFQPFSRFPGASRDLAFVVPDAIPSDLILQDAEKAARKAAGAAFTGVRVFDVYRGKGVADGHRSIALRLSFRSLERTLADAEVDAATAQVESRLSQRDGVALRR